MYFSESLAPAVYGSTNSNSKPFIDRLWAMTSIVNFVSVCFLNRLLYTGPRGRRLTLFRWCKCLLPVLQGFLSPHVFPAGYRGSFYTQAGCWSACIPAWLCQSLLQPGWQVLESLQTKGHWIGLEEEKMPWSVKIWWSRFMRFLVP